MTSPAMVARTDIRPALITAGSLISWHGKRKERRLLRQRWQTGVLIAIPPTRSGKTGELENKEYTGV